MKITKKLLLKIIKEEVANVLSESGGSIDLADLRGTVSFYQKLFPDWDVAEEARKIRAEALASSKRSTYGVVHRVPNSFPAPPRSGRWVPENQINEYIRQLLHTEARRKWNLFQAKGPRLTVARALKSYSNHLRKIIPGGEQLTKSEIHSLVKKINEFFNRPSRPTPGSPNIRLSYDPGKPAKAAIAKQLWSIFNKGVPSGGLTLAKPLPGEGELSIVDQKEKVKAAIDDAGKPEAPGMKPAKPGSRSWMSRLSKGISKFGGPLLGIAGIGALWNECEGDLECLAINMMTLGPVKVVKDEDIMDIPATGRFGVSIKKAGTGKGSGASDSW